jgi:hypothetical protein
MKENRFTILLKNPRIDEFINKHEKTKFIEKEFLHALLFILQIIIIMV